MSRIVELTILPLQKVKLLSAVAVWLQEREGSILQIHLKESRRFLFRVCIPCDGTGALSLTGERFLCVQAAVAG